MAKKDEFDVLTFFIYVMLLLTAIVGGFAALNYTKVSEERKQIRINVTKLAAMQELAMDEQFREHIGLDRKNQQTIVGGSSADFQALYLSRARENNVEIGTHSLEGTVNHPGGVELPFRLNIKQCRVEELLKFLVRVEEDWPGAKVKEIAKLDYIERNEKKGWDAVIVLSIFKPNDA